MTSYFKMGVCKNFTKNVVNIYDEKIFQIN